MNHSNISRRDDRSRDKDRDRDRDKDDRRSGDRRDRDRRDDRDERRSGRRESRWGRENDRSRDRSEYNFRFSPLFIEIDFSLFYHIDLILENISLMKGKVL